MSRILPLMLISLIFIGCAGTPPISSELKKGVKTAVFIQQGTQPTLMKFGIVDAASFWKDFGAAHSVAVTSSELNRPSADKVMRDLLGDHSMSSQVAKKLMPLYANEWGVPYHSKKLFVMKKGKVKSDKNGFMSGIKTKADLVLVIEVPLVKFNEKKSLAGGLLAGLTLGTNEKDVAAEISVSFRAYKKDNLSRKHKLVREGNCYITEYNMDKKIPFKEVIKSKEKAKILWDDATEKGIKICGDLIKHF